MLYGDQVRPDEGDVVDLAEHLDHSCVVDTRDHHAEQVSEQRGLLLQVEREGLVVASEGHVRTLCLGDEEDYAHLDVRYADDDILELVVLPSIRGPLDHGESSIVLGTCQ